MKAGLLSSKAWLRGPFVRNQRVIIIIIIIIIIVIIIIIIIVIIVKIIIIIKKYLYSAQSTTCPWRFTLKTEDI